MHAVQSYSIRTASGQTVDVHHFGTVEYLDAEQAMREFASSRTQLSPDQIWILQHPAVYTQGTACDQSTLAPTSIPVVKTDRGGQITYHGKGQLVMYPLLRLRDHGLGVKQLVATLEQSVINLLHELGIEADRRDNAPGVYVNDAKVSALGLRIRRGTSYHGLSLNVEMDLTPFSNIDPCGYRDLKVTQLADLTDSIDIEVVQKRLPLEFVSLI